jgi:hypothetical protein
MMSRRGERRQSRRCGRSLMERIAKRRLRQAWRAGRRFMKRSDSSDKGDLAGAERRDTADSIGFP